MNSRENLKTYKKYFILVWLVMENSGGFDLFKELSTKFIPDVHSHHYKWSPVKAYA
jgi:hypothetical protein